MFSTPFVPRLRGILLAQSLNTYIHATTPIKIIIEECSESIIDQGNMIPNFYGKNNQVRIQSFYASYYCDDDEEQKVLLEEGIHYKWKGGMIAEPEVPCPLCSKPMLLDADPKVYFYFLQ